MNKKIKLILSVILTLVLILCWLMCNKPVINDDTTTTLLITSTVSSSTTSTALTTTTITTVTTTITTTTVTTVTTTSTTTTIQYDAMVQISAVDSYTMGDGFYGPNVNMSITYNFKMSKYEVTNGWYAQAIADGLYSNSSYWTTNGWTWKVGTANPSDKPSYWTDANYNGTDQPVLGVSWYEAVAFCNWLSVKKGLSAVYNSSGAITSLTANGYRLPTEVEWQYCASKGASGQTERIYAYGSTWDCTKVICSVSSCSATKTANVGSKPTGDTPQGLSDMNGNLLELCSDNTQLSPVSGTNRYYFVNDSTSQTFEVRGASWSFFDVNSLRCANRSYNSSPNGRSVDIGFRVLLP